MFLTSCLECGNRPQFTTVHHAGSDTPPPQWERGVVGPIRSDAPTNRVRAKREAPQGTSAQPGALAQDRCPRRLVVDVVRQVLTSRQLGVVRPVWDAPSECL